MMSCSGIVPNSRDEADGNARSGGRRRERHASALVEQFPALFSSCTSGRVQCSHWQNIYPSASMTPITNALAAGYGRLYPVLATSCQLDCRHLLKDVLFKYHTLSNGNMCFPTIISTCGL